MRAQSTVKIAAAAEDFGICYFMMMMSHQLCTKQALWMVEQLLLLLKIELAGQVSS